jgi:UDP-3-O-[3-hydroxymyristoyl] glucosamine N-acyltransferase
MAGSTTIGKHCVLAGGCGIAGSSPITLCDGVVVSVKTTISQSIDKPGTYSGAIVASEHKQWLRNALRFNNLGQLFVRVKKLENERADESS